MFRSVLAVVLGVTSIAPAIAGGPYSLTIHDTHKPRMAIQEITIEGGTVLGLPRMRDQTMEDMELQVMLDGPCTTKLTIVFRYRADRHEMTADFCGPRTIPVVVQSP